MVKVLTATEAALASAEAGMEEEMAMAAMAMVERAEVADTVVAGMAREEGWLDVETVAIVVARREAMMVVRKVAAVMVTEEVGWDMEKVVAPMATGAAAAGTGVGNLERVAGALVSEPLAEASSVVKATVAKAEAGDEVEWMEAAMERAEVAMPVKVWVATMAPVAEEQRASANVVVVVVRQAMATGGCTPGSPGKIGRCCT